MSATLEAPVPAPDRRSARAVVGQTWTDRLVTPLPDDRVRGWVVTALVGLLAGYLRFHHLGKLFYTTSSDGKKTGFLTGTYTDSGGCIRYYQDIFDETYYHHDSLNLLHHGVEQNCQNTGAGFIVHPPLGKWMIGAGIKVFGNNPFGWRSASAIAGTLAVIVLVRLGRRMFGSTVLGAFAGLLMTFDGLEFVQSRVALLDIFLMLFELLALACLVLDRADGRRRLARRLDAGASADWPGPRLGFRPWRLATGIMLGASLAVKWDGLYEIPASAALALAWDAGARRSAGVPKPVRAALRREWLGWIPGFFVAPTATYTLCWTGWFLGTSQDAYDRHLDGRSGVVGSVQNWLAYQCEAYNFHKNLTDNVHYGGGVAIPIVNFCRDAHVLHDPGKLHPYLSKPWGWFVLSRPVAFYYESPPQGVDGCKAKTCSAEVLDIGTPAIWWAALLALLVVLGIWLARRDWRSASILVAVAAGFVPWLFYESRQMFFFYALPLLPMICLALAMVAGVVMGGPDASENRRFAGGISAGVYLMVVVVNFLWLYPLLTGETLSYASWHARIWFPGWV